MADGGNANVRTHDHAVASSQDTSHGEDHDYKNGSPHLADPSLRTRLDDRIIELIAETLERQGSCTVLEIGAGHGSFTDTVIAAGGTATVTEMSEASYRHLSDKFGDASSVRVIFDPDGGALARDDTRFDLVLLISVIHHIPDYLGVVAGLCDDKLKPGGAILTFQDPLWYPRQTRWARWITAGCYLGWRLTQGELKRGMRTRLRRLRGVYDDAEPSDLVEYHVVRDGVDDIALRNLFSDRFATVDVDRYFSTQSTLLQAIGANILPHNTFGIVARRRVELAT